MSAVASSTSGGTPGPSSEKAADNANAAATPGATEATMTPEQEARLARLARKAESARLARARHKEFVAKKQNEVVTLQSDEKTMMEQEKVTSVTALVAVRRELRAALSSEQLRTLEGWLRESPGGDVLAEMYIGDTATPALPPLPPLPELGLPQLEPAASAPSPHPMPSVEAAGVVKQEGNMASPLPLPLSNLATNSTVPVAVSGGNDSGPSMPGSSASVGSANAGASSTGARQALTPAAASASDSDGLLTNASFATAKAMAAAAAAAAATAAANWSDPVLDVDATTADVQPVLGSGVQLDGDGVRGLKRPLPQASSASSETSTITADDLLSSVFA